jgi:RNA polymerase sigma factor (sigma-70 family)
MQLDLPANATADWNAEDDRGLIDAARNDPQAFAALYQRHYQSIAGYLFRRTADRHATEDLLSEVFLQAMRRLGIFRWTGIPLRFWLLRIATNAANRWAQRRRREAELMQRVTNEHFRPTPNEAPLEEPDERVQRAVARLSPPHQAVIALHYVECFLVEDTARILGCRVGTVKSRLARARNELRAALTNKEKDDVRTDRSRG